ncbi:MAG: glycosyltransferase [Casimicrobiaceae bacterium]
MTVAPSTPRVSVIVPTRNRPALLEEALQSLADQTFRDWEAVVVDDGSEPAVDGDALALRFGARVRLQRHEAGLGGASAKNTGSRAARAAILAFLDDDDLFAPQYLARAIEALDRHPDLDGIFMKVGWFGARQAVAEADSDRAMRRALELAQGHERAPGLLVFDHRLFAALLQTVPMTFQRIVVRRSVFEKIGGYEPHCLLWDCDWAIRASATGRFGLVLDALYRQRAQGQGTSSRPERRLEHMRSRAEINDRLHVEGARYGLDRGQCRAARDSAAAAWFSVAYFHCTERHAVGEALRAWIASQRRLPSLRRCTFLVRLVRGGLVGRRFRRMA